MHITKNKFKQSVLYRLLKVIFIINFIFFLVVPPIVIFLDEILGVSDTALLKKMEETNPIAKESINRARNLGRYDFQIIDDFRMAYSDGIEKEKYNKYIDKLNSEIRIDNAKSIGNWLLILISPIITVFFFWFIKSLFYYIFFGEKFSFKKRVMQD